MKKSISTLSALAALTLLAACGETKNSSAPAASTPAATASAPAQRALLLLRLNRLLVLQLPG